MWKYLEAFLVGTTGVATGILWVEVREATKYPMPHRTAPITKNFLYQIVNSAKIEKRALVLQEHCKNIRKYR